MSHIKSELELFDKEFDFKNNQLSYSAESKTDRNWIRNYIVASHLRLLERVIKQMQEKFEILINDAEQRDQYGGTGKETAKIISESIISELKNIE